MNEYQEKNLMLDVLGDSEYTKIIRSPAALELVGMFEKREYECVMNKISL